MMNMFKRYRNLWMLGIITVLAILFIVNISVVVSGFQAVWRSITGLLYGAALAFVLNLIMDPTERLLKENSHPWVKDHARALAITVSLLVAILIIILIMALVIPNLVNAFTVLANEAPSYVKQLEELTDKLGQLIPALDNTLSGVTLSWKDIVDNVLKFLTKGITTSEASNAVSSTLGLFSSVVGGFVNLFVIVVFSIYVLADKERFVRMYYFLCELYLKKTTQRRLTRNLRIISRSFKAFVGGEIIEACILTTMCTIGMWILQLPYATMIGVLVGVINMIPMFGAFIGGGIGALIIFTISPVKCLIFLVFLCIIQQIESNIFFPRIIGNRVGLPGIYVMMTIVVGGSLFGVLGMVLGVPLVASIYKILRLYFQEKYQDLHQRHASGTPDPDERPEEAASKTVSLADEVKNLNA